MSELEKILAELNKNEQELIDTVGQGAKSSVAARDAQRRQQWLYSQQAEAARTDALNMRAKREKAEASVMQARLGKEKIREKLEEGGEQPQIQQQRVDPERVAKQGGAPGQMPDLNEIFGGGGVQTGVEKVGQPGSKDFGVYETSSGPTDFGGGQIGGLLNNINAVLGLFGAGLQTTSKRARPDLTRQAFLDFKEQTIEPKAEALARKMAIADEDTRNEAVGNQLLENKKLGPEVNYAIYERARNISHTNRVAQADALSKQTFDRETELMTEHVKLSKGFIKTRNQFARVQASVESPSAAGDLSLIFAYMKLLDPDSAVREGEQATARNTGTIPETIWNTYNRLVETGEGFTAFRRADFANRARRLMGRAVSEQQVIDQRFRGLATRNQLDPDNVAMDFIADLSSVADMPDPPKSHPDAIFVRMDGNMATFIKKDNKLFTVEVE